MFANPKKISNEGLSLPLVIGLVSVLMVGAVAANALVIRNLKATREIESATRAYLVAEGGIEDALYELSAHAPGYETPDLESRSPAPRSFDFSNNLSNRWTIQSHLNRQSPGGKLYPDSKAIVYLFNDISTQRNTAQIKTIDVSGGGGRFVVTFTIPSTLIDASNGFSAWLVNNDLDEELAATAPNPQTNEDEGNTTDCPSHRQGCDSSRDPVIYWKLSDDAGNSLSPITGCLGDSTSTDPKSEICEKDFPRYNGTSISMNIDQNATGRDQNNENKTIARFISDVYEGRYGNPIGSTKLTMEFFLVAPIEDASNGRSLNPIKLPYLEYSIASNAGNLPDPYFTLKSDGFDGDFKQSITAQVKPKYLLPLFDFTILQQE